MTNLLILQCGYLDHHKRMEYMKNYLKKNLIGDYEIINSSVNDGKTGDGIINGGKRLFCLIKQLFSQLETGAMRQIQPQKKYDSISFIGHSLGGLYARSCIGLLEEENFFSTIIPKFFISIDTPHIGARCNKIINWLSSKSNKGSFSELFLHDNNQIIYAMSNVNSSYMIGLNKFKVKLVYGNIANGKITTNNFMVSTESACICHPLKEKKYEINNLITIDQLNDCVNESGNEIFNNLSTINLTRKAVNQGIIFDPHGSLASMACKKNIVLNDIIECINKYTVTERI